MMRTILMSIIGFLLALPIGSVAQVYDARMDAAISQGDTALQRKILHEWQFEWPNDPDWMLARSAFFSRKAAAADSLARATHLAESVAQLETATQHFPDRLDIQFAYISLLGDQGDFEEYTAQILDLIGAHDRIRPDWLWRNNKKLQDVDNFVRQYIDMYTLLLYNQKDEALYPLMDTISNRILDSYPLHVPALLSLAINAQHRQDYQAAIAYLQSARTAEPENTSVLDNLGGAYEKTGDNAGAIECYEQILAVGDDQEKAYANQKILALSAP